MLEPPHMVDVPEQTTAVIRLRIPAEECREHWGPALHELLAELAKQGIAPAGPVFDHHFSPPDTHFDFEIGVPVSTPVTPTGRVAAGKRPACRAARAVLVGDYDQLPEAWPRLMTWIGEQRLDPAADLWQIFVSGPESGPDPATWRTELVRPLFR